MIESKQQKKSDFWWLTSEEATKYKYLYVCSHEPYSDEPNSNRIPSSDYGYYSLDESGQLSRDIKYYPLEYVYYWRKRNDNINVFRSVGLFSAEQNGDELYGPFLIDIDRQEKLSRGYVQNLNKALEDARQLIKEYLREFEETDFRIFFTGHKGFNIEVHPHALGIVSLGKRGQQFSDIRKDINRIYGDRFVDNMHDEIRLHDSINRWVANDGKLMSRMKFELSLHELNTMTVEEICRKSEKLALDYLSSR